MSVRPPHKKTVQRLIQPAHARRIAALGANNFVSSGSLTSYGGALTLSRAAGSVYYFNGSGILTATGDNVAAFTSNGLFIEGEATNLIAAANYRDISTWTSTGVTMKATTPSGIDGTTLTVSKNEFMEDTGNTEHRKQISWTAATAAKQSVMVAVKRGAGSRHVQVRINNATDGIYGSVAVNLDTLAVIGTATADYWTAYVKGDYTIIELVDTNTTTGSQNLHVNIHDGSTISYAGDGTSTLILDWAQVVTSGLAQSHVQGAATRYSSFIYRPWIGATINWWVYVDFIFKFSNQALISGVNYYAISIRADVNNASTLRFLTGGTGLIRINSTNLGVTQIADVSNFSVDRGDRCRAVLSFDSVNGLRCRVRNGESAAQTAQVTTSKAPIAALASNTNLYLGSLDGLTITSVLQSELGAYKVGTGILTTEQMTEMVGA